LRLLSEKNALSYVVFAFYMLLIATKQIMIP